jgi:uncharacterized protein YjbI with pentapeptide repeats
MANPELIARLNEGVEAWNASRVGPPTATDLSRADFSGRNLSGAGLRYVDLSDANLRGANLRAVDLTGANLSGASLREANLQGTNFSGTNLSGASLREANLEGADLGGAKGGLQTEQLAGADLTSATLPPELAKLYDSLENVNNISESARKLFLAVLAACLYSWLTIATTTDVSLITNRASSPLPIIQTSIPIVGFYWVAPLLLLCVYFYLHFYLQKLWEELGSLPAIFPDGRPLHTKIDPWLLNDLVRAHLPKLSADRPFLSYLQLWISVLLAWWVVPITMFLFWGRYLPRHERSGTTFHVVLLAISVAAALRLYWLAVATLRGVERGPFRFSRLSAKSRGYQAAALVVAVAALFAIVSWGARWGVPSDAPILGIRPIHRSERGEATGPLTWVPRLMALVGYSPFLDLTDAEVSQKKPNWSNNEKDIDAVVGAQLKRANLRYAIAPGAFFNGAFMEGADLSGADLHRADLHGAKLFGATLNSVDLRDANFAQANLNGADLRGAELSRANVAMTHLGYSDLRGARNLNLEGLKYAREWNEAFYDDETLKALGLPPDHNAKVAEQQKKENELPQE